MRKVGYRPRAQHGESLPTCYGNDQNMVTDLGFQSCIFADLFFVILHFLGDLLNPEKKRHASTWGNEQFWVVSIAELGTQTHLTVG